jgi:hypothetical protein
MSNQIITLESVDFHPRKLNSRFVVNGDGKVENPLGMDVDKVVILESTESDDICIKGSCCKIIRWDIKEDVSIEGFPVFDIMESGELYVDLTEEEMNEWLIKKQLPVF